MSKNTYAIISNNIYVRDIYIIKSEGYFPLFVLSDDNA